MRTLIVAALIGSAAPAFAEEAKTFQIPYRLTKTQHVMVRVKLNGKGPFNFIIDTGAPALIVNQDVAEKLGVEPGEGGWTKFDKMELEGGLVVPKAEGLVLDMFQLKGMNGLGLAGVKLNGVIGYNLLARYRIGYDFTKSKLKFTPLDFEPPEIARIGGASQGGLEVMGTVMKFMGSLLGIKPNFEYVPRGFLGVEVEQNDDGHLLISKVIEGSPAEKAGLKIGDRIKTAARKDVDSPADLTRVVGEVAEGQKLRVLISRDGEDQIINLKLGKGL